VEHWDLADTVYCPCNARIKKTIQTMEDDETTFIVNQDLAIPPIPLFCKRNKQSIIQTRRTFLCSYLISMERPASPETYPYHTCSPGRPKTRSLTRNENPQSKPAQPSQPNQPNEQDQQGEQGKQKQPAAIALHGQLASKGSKAHQYQKGGRRKPKNIIASGVGLLRSPRKASPNSEEHNWEERL
jgi:hypothetical protein